MSSAKSFPNGIENAKRGAAFAAVNIFVEDGQTIGVGSGSTIEYAVQRLAERVSDEKIKVTCVPTSYQARDLVLKYKLPLSDLNRHLYLDVAIDGADEVDEGFTLIKGGGGMFNPGENSCSCRKEVCCHSRSQEKVEHSWRQMEKR
uniref:ribose-5-phosphate isomerase n=1 Tax=Ciona savignyi TaxID=51511 RepID=H2YX29_CIOSA